MGNLKPKKRQFLGKTENFKSKRERSFFQRMLKAYLAGHEYFHFGYENVTPFRRERKLHKVLQKTFSKN